VHQCSDYIDINPGYIISRDINPDIVVSKGINPGIIVSRGIRPSVIAPKVIDLGVVILNDFFNNLFKGLYKALKIIKYTYIEDIT
jgi:hypothetical protein